jgi:hypothetical protein
LLRSRAHLHVSSKIRECVTGSIEAFSPKTKQRFTDALAKTGSARDTRRALVCAGWSAVLNTPVDATDAFTAKSASNISEYFTSTDDHFIPARVASESAELGQWFDTKPGTLGPLKVLLMSVVLVHVTPSPEHDKGLLRRVSAHRARARLAIAARALRYRLERAPRSLRTRTPYNFCVRSSRLPRARAE